MAIRYKHQHFIIIIMLFESIHQTQLHYTFCPAWVSFKQWFCVYPLVHCEACEGFKERDQSSMFVYLFLYCIENIFCILEKTTLLFA